LDIAKSIFRANPRPLSQTRGDRGWSRSISLPELATRAAFLRSLTPCWDWRRVAGSQMIPLEKNWNCLLEPMAGDTKYSFALSLPLEGAEHLRIRTPYCFQQMLISSFDPESSMFKDSIHWERPRHVMPSPKKDLSRRRASLLFFILCLTPMAVVVPERRQAHGDQIVDVNGWMLRADDLE
jgi:hypothetical protein